MILDMAPKASLAVFLRRCESFGMNSRVIKRMAVETMQHMNKRAPASPIWTDLEARWYKSLENGNAAPDWGVYDVDAYMGELWVCWAVYSRKYLRNIRHPRSMVEGGSVVEDLAPVKRVLDLGCGFGFTTAALRQLFPDAEVIGTNLDTAKQTRFARQLGEAHGFIVVPEVKRTPVDLVFASEYFEHFPAPIEHLEHVLEYADPRALLVANAFGTRAIGHFETYDVGGTQVSGKVASKAFAELLRERGYRKANTRMWNNRPTYWKR